MKIAADPWVRFLGHVDKEGPIPEHRPELGRCWQWTSTTNRKGYGQFWNQRQTLFAHRYAYEHLVGPIPVGLQIDHLCRNPGCVNPSHCEPVTAAENVRRRPPAVGVQTLYGRRTHCGRGHEFTPENTATRADHPARRCRACDRQNRAAWVKRQKRAA